MALGKVIKNSGVYTLVSILQKGISFFLLPLYTAFLTPADYGILNIVTTVSSIISLFILLGLDGATSRFYYKNPTDKKYVANLWGALTTCVIICSLVIGGLLLVFHNFLIDPLVGNISYYPYIFLGILYTIVSPLYLLFQSSLRAQQFSIHYGFNILANFVVNTGLIILFVAVWHKGVVGVLLANLITAVLFFLYVCIAYIPKLKLNLRREYVIPAYKYSLPLIPHLLAGWSTGLIDRLLINGMRGESETGLYSVAHQFSSIITTITNSVNMAFTPWMYESLNNNRHRDIRVVALIATLMYSLLALLISLFSPELLTIMVTEQYQGIWNVISIMVFAMVFNGLYFFFVDILFVEKTKLIFIISFSTMIMNILLNILFIPKYGFAGAAWACFITYFFKSLVALALYKKNNENVEYNWPLMYIVVFGAFSMSFINFPLANMNLVTSLIIKFLFVTILIVVISLLIKKRYPDMWQVAITTTKNRLRIRRNQ